MQIVNHVDVKHSSLCSYTLSRDTINLRRLVIPQIFYRKPYGRMTSSCLVCTPSTTLIFVTAFFMSFSISMPLHSVGHRSQILCQLNKYACMPTVSDCNVTRELTPHWFYANSSRAHKNRARVSRPFLPHAGDAMHPALWKREGLGMRLHVSLLISHQTSNNTGRHLIAIGLNWSWATNNQRGSWDNEILVSKFSLVTGLCHNTSTCILLAG